MTDMHPHWHSTGTDATDAADDGAEPVKIRVQEPGMIGNLRGVSRAPAAVVGIALVIAAGVWAAGGWGMFAGQASQTDVLEGRIHITPDGPVPETILAEPGDTVTWVNDDTGPHIIASDTLKTASATTLYSTTIFAGSVYGVTLAETLDDGAYEYRFETQPSWKGTIIVKEGGCSEDDRFGGLKDVDLPGYDPCRDYQSRTNNNPAGGNTASAAPANTQTSSASQVSSVSFTVPAPIEPDPVAINPVAPVAGIIMPPATAKPATSPSEAGGEQNLPYNPYTVASDGSSVRPSSKQTASAVSPVHAGGGKAPSQPESGPEVWITVILTLCAGLFAIRRHVVAFEIKD